MTANADVYAAGTVRLLLLVPTVVLTCVIERANAQLLDPSGFVPKTSDTRLRFWGIDAGSRATWSNGVAPQGSFGVSRTVGMNFPLTFAIGAGWDIGAAKRDDAWGLSQRLLGRFDARWHARSREAFGFLRAAAGMLVDRAGVEPAFEGSVGLSLSIAEMDEDPTEHLPRLWLAPEAGFSHASGLNGPFARLMVTMSF